MFYSWLLRGPILTFNYISHGKPLRTFQYQPQVPTGERYAIQRKRKGS